MFVRDGFTRTFQRGNSPVELQETAKSNRHLQQCLGLSISVLLIHGGSETGAGASAFALSPPGSDESRECEDNANELSDEGCDGEDGDGKSEDGGWGREDNEV